ncbi:hypothetical protein BG000_007408 [Podila horticola]|nr:hypothetical protein BG000_007408 [Podila horticola]
MTLLSEEASTLKKQKTVYPFSFLTQRRVIMKRNLQTLILDKTLLVLHRVVFMVLGLFIGGSNFAQHFCPGTDTILYYPLAPFTISTLPFDLIPLLFDLIPLRIVPAILMDCISYWMTGLNSDLATFFKFLLILLLVNISTALFCLVIAAGVRATGVDSLTSSIAMLFMMLFGRFLINSGQIPRALTWIQYLSMFRYEFEALAVNEIATSKLIDNIQSVAFNVPGSMILQKLFGVRLGGFWRNLIFLVGFDVLFVVVSFGHW